jgi:hypothetical protein
VTEPAKSLDERVTDLTRLLLLAQDRITALEQRSFHNAQGRVGYTHGTGHGLWPDYPVR